MSHLGPEETTKVLNALFLINLHNTNKANGILSKYGEQDIWGTLDHITLYSYIANKLSSDLQTEKDKEFALLISAESGLMMMAIEKAESCLHK